MPSFWLWLRLRLRLWLRHRRRLQLWLCALLTARGGDRLLRCTRFRPSVSCCCESLTRFFLLSLLPFVMYLLCLVCLSSTSGVRLCLEWETEGTRRFVSTKMVFKDECLVFPLVFPVWLWMSCIADGVASLSSSNNNAPHWCKCSLRATRPGQARAGQTEVLAGMSCKQVATGKSV